MRTVIPSLQLSGLVLLLGLALMPFGRAAGARVNLLANGGFEPPFAEARPTADVPGTKAAVSGRIAAGWEDNSAWADVTVDYGPETENPDQGSAAQRIEVREVRGGWVNFVQRVHLKKGEAYRASLRLRGKEFSNVTLMLRKTGAPYTIHAQKKLTLSPEWKTYSLPAIAPEDGDAFLMLTFRGAATVWADDARFENMSEGGGERPRRAGNLLPNGSFEAGLSGGWGFWMRELNWLALASRSQWDYAWPAVDAGSAADGSRSLRIEIPPGRMAILTSPYVPFNFNRVHSGSIALKADREATVELWLEGVTANRLVKVGPEWRRFSISASVPYAATTRFTVRCWARQPTVLWCDAAQLEEREEPSPDYQPKFPLELGLSVPRAGAIVFAGEALPVGIATSAPLPAGARLRWAVIGLDDREQPLPELALSGAAQVMLPEPERRLGLFKLRGRVVGPDGAALSAPVEAIFARLPRPRELPAEKSYFGTHMPLRREFIDIARSIGLRWVRLHDTANPTKWRYVEETRDDFQFEDRGIDAARAGGLQILGMLDGAPPWASREPWATEGYRSTYNMPDGPDALERWSHYVRKVAGHYRGKIDYWEIWNEPWVNDFFFRGTPADYAGLVRRAWEAAKEVNPSAQIVAVNSVAHSGQSDVWSARVLAELGGRYFDIFSVHDYNSSLHGGPAPKPVQTVAKFNAMMKTAGSPARPIWNTEGGPGEIMSWYWADEETRPTLRAQMAHIVRWDVTQIAAGIGRIFYYMLYAEGSTRPLGFDALEQDRSLRPAMAAQAVLASLIDGAACAGRAEEPLPGIDAYRFVHPDGTGVTVCWSYDGRTHLLPVPAGAEALDIFGNRIDGAAVSVADEPVYLKDRQP